MKNVKYSICWIGVALLATPVSNVVFAQQGPNLLLEMQSIRAEIAELRDMVERQKYEIANLKRQSPNQAVGVAPVNSSGVNNYQANNGSVNNTGNYQNTYSNDSFNNDLNNTANSTSNSTIGNTGSNVGGAYNNPYNSTPLPNTPQQGTYSQPATVLDNTIGASSVQPSVESRTLNTNNSAVSQQANSTYPPVDEIVLGQDAVVLGQNPNLNPNLNQAAAVSNSSQQFEQPNQTIEPVNQSGGFIAVPLGQSGQVAAPAVSKNAVNNLPNGANGAVNAAAVPVASSSSSAAAQYNSNTSPKLLPQNVPEVPVGAQPEQEYYQQGFEQLKKSKHADAIVLFKKQISVYPNGDLADDAHYWIAESQYVNRKLDESKQYFKIILDRFKQSPRLPDAMLKTAYIEQEQGNNIEARILLQEIVQYHPRSNAAISAKNRLAEIK